MVVLMAYKMGAASTASPGGRRGDRAPCSAGTASTRRGADAEGVHAPAGHTGPAARARRGRSAGVLRPWHAGRETAKHVGAPRRSGLEEASPYGRQLRRPRRGTPATAPGWNRSREAAHVPGRRRSPVTGHARRMGRGSRIAPRTPRWGKPATRGRSRRQPAARHGHAARTGRTGSG